MSKKPTVYVVDDDPSMLRSMCRILKSMSWHVEGFVSPEEFLGELDTTLHGCIVLDIRLPGISGLTIQRRLLSNEVRKPIVFVSGYADVPSTVEVMRAGALYLLEKPFREQALLDCVALALAWDNDCRAMLANRADAKSRLGLLTRREREVLDFLVAGRINKQTAAELSISERTVESHRVNIMKKTRANSVAELVRFALTADLDVETNYDSTRESIYSRLHI